MDSRCITQIALTLAETCRKLEALMDGTHQCGIEQPTECSIGLCFVSGTLKKGDYLQPPIWRYAPNIRVVN